MNWLVFFIALAYSVEQNNYFGWNWLPKSDAELITDGITALLFVIALCGGRK